MTALLNFCENCAHMKNDGDGKEWDYCNRPNYPPGNWNLLVHVQRYGGFDEACNGRFYERKAAQYSAKNEVLR